MGWGGSQLGNHLERLRLGLLQILGEDGDAVADRREEERLARRTVADGGRCDCLGFVGHFDLGHGAIGKCYQYISDFTLKVICIETAGPCGSMISLAGLDWICVSSALPESCQLVTSER